MAENIELIEKASATENNITEALSWREVEQAIMGDDKEKLENMMRRFGKLKETSSSPKS